MAKTRHNTLSTAGGLVSPKLDARVDQQKYGTWLRQCQNMIPYRSGGLTRAVGTQYIGAAKYANASGHNYSVRMIPFIFSTNTEFMLEFGHHYIRFYSNGQQVHVSTAPVWVTTKFYNPGLFVIDPFDGLIYYSIQGNSAKNPHLFPAFWTQQTILECYTPYEADALTGDIYDTDIWGITPCQINDVVYFTNPLFAVWSLTRTSNVEWATQEVPFLTPALLDENATNTILTPTQLTGFAGLMTASAPAWMAAYFYLPGNSVEVTGVIYNCIVPNTSSAVFADDLARGWWEAVVIFNALHVGSTWQYSVLRSSSYLEYDGVAATGFADGTSGTIDCMGTFTVRTYGVWSSDIAIQRSQDNGQTWVTINTITSRDDNNETFTGTAVVQSLFRFVITNSVVPTTPGATDPRVVFTVQDAFLRGLFFIYRLNTNYSVDYNVITPLSDSNGLQPAWVSGQAYVVGNKVSFQGSNYNCTLNVTSSTIPPNDPGHWMLIFPGGSLYWSEAAWSDYRGFPRAVTTFQQRMIYASSGFEPQRIWGTQTNDIENFDRSDPSLATGGFAYDLNAPSRGPIVWLTAQADLFAGFEGAEWVINAGNSGPTVGSGGAITPTNINAVEQGTFGSAPTVQPAIVGNAVFFAQRQADAMRQMLFSVYTAKYMSQDLTALSDNLFASGIVQLAYQSRWRHQGILWVVTKQGSMCGLTYDLDQEVFGWCMRLTGFGQTDLIGNPVANDNGIESAAVLYSSGSSDDEVWVVANRMIGGVQTRYIERVNPNNWEEEFAGSPDAPTPSLPDAFYVDSGLTITSPGSRVLTGLGHLEGRYVVGLADGNAFGPLLVASGSVTLPASFPTTVTTVQIGLQLPYAGQPMRIDSDPKAGNTQTLVKTISDVYVRVWNSVGGSISNGTANYQKWISGQTYAVGDLVISPLNDQPYRCIVATSGVVDPSADTTNWTTTPQPFFRLPVPIPYTNAQGVPFPLPQLVTVPTEFKLGNQGDKALTTDPQFIVSGNDAKPITVLATGIHYDIIGTS